MRQDDEELFDDGEFDELDEEFPLGDGTADAEATVSCPYCGEAVEITLDPAGGTRQDYVEDCEVCCNPIEINCTVEDDAIASFNAKTLE